VKHKVFAIMSFLLVLVSFNAVAQSDSSKKEWTFPSPHGILHVSAASFPSGTGTRVTRLEITPAIRGSWTVAEEAAALDSVLADLPKNGFELRSLASISFRLNERDAISRLATHAALSKTWRGGLRTRIPAKFYPLVVRFLNESDAYKAWNDVFAKRALKLQAVSVEEVAIEPFSKSGASCPPTANCVRLSVPSDAFVQINILPMIGR
jgi:hypothetical protein